MKAIKYYWGIDCGSAEIKIAVLDGDHKIVNLRKHKTLFPLIEHVRAALGTDQSGLSPFLGNSDDISPDHRIIVTGYGRNHIDIAHDRLTEIKAHFLGVSNQIILNKDYTIIDIGGQDSKVITIKNGDIHHFVINRKCAAGTGAFIEELAHRLNIRLEDMTKIESKHDKKLALNSYCTVFAGQEVIKVLMEGERLENLIHALYESVVKRVTEMTAIGTDTVVFSGGVMNFHPALSIIFQNRWKAKELILAPNAQYCGAIGAAFYGIQKGHQNAG